MLDVIGPAPGDENAYIQEKFHGKSARSSRTFSVVNGAWFSGAAKIIAPVRAQRTRPGLRELEAAPLARRRRYSETLTRSCLARDRIKRASSSLTLNVIVVILVIR